MADPKNAPAGNDFLAGLGIAPPPSIAAGNARQPLGPPTGFFQEQAAVNPALAGFSPYLQGDEWVPAYSMSPEDRDRLKARMNAAGLYGSSGYQSGSWTADDANAYQQVLESANGMGQRDPNVVIDNIAQEVRKGPRVAGPRAPLVSHVSNPDTIRAVLRDSAFSLTGSRLSDDDEQRLISLYQGQQQSASQAAYAAGETSPAGGAGGTITDPASVQAFANAQIEKARPEDVATHRYIGAFNKILGSMGTLANATPTYQGAGLPTTQGQEVL
jgi:hypothetical protein